MATLITRYFDNATQVQPVKHELVFRRRLSPRIIRVFDRSEGLAETLAAAGVSEETARAYQKRVATGGAVLMVRAGYKPLGVARITRDVTAAMGAADMGGLVEEAYVKDDRKPLLSVLADHPHMLTRPRDPSSTTFHMADWPIPLILRRPPFRAQDVPGHRHMLGYPVPLIDRRKPFTGSIFPRHARMANFPIPLLSRRKPFTGSIFPRHARMAGFPIPPISHRKPFSGSVFPRHAHMANIMLPLVIKHSEPAPNERRSGFSFSRLLGLPTLVRR